MTTTEAPPAVPAQRMSNRHFAERVGCTPTMASRLRSGQRMPSVQMLFRICEAFSLDKAVAVERHAAGRETFSAWLRSEVLDSEPAAA